MSDERTIPTVDAVIAELRRTGTGTRKLDVIQQWIAANPTLNSEDLLLWAEDLQAKYPDMLGDGTIKKIGLQVVGEEYALRRPNETVTDELKRLRIHVNDMEKQLRLAQSGGSHNSRIAALDQATIRGLQEENLELRRQLEIATASGEAREPTTQPQPDVPSRRVRTGVQKKASAGANLEEAVGQPAAV